MFIIVNLKHFYLCTSCRVVSVGRDSTVRIWERDSGGLLCACVCVCVCAG